MQRRRKVEKRALIAVWGNRRIHDKTDKRNADVYADIAKGVKEKWLSWTWLEAVLKKVRETSKRCNYHTRIFVSFSQLRGNQFDGNEEELSKIFGIELLATQTIGKSGEDAWNNRAWVVEKSEKSAVKTSDIQVEKDHKLVGVAEEKPNLYI